MVSPDITYSQSTHAIIAASGIAATIAIGGGLLFWRRARAYAQSYATRSRKRRDIWYIATMQSRMAELLLFLEQGGQQKHPAFGAVSDAITHIGSLSNRAVPNDARAELQTPDLPGIADRQQREKGEKGLAQGPATPVPPPLQPRIQPSVQLPSQQPKTEAGQTVHGARGLRTSRSVISLDGGAHPDQGSLAASHVWRNKRVVRLNGRPT